MRATFLPLFLVMISLFAPSIHSFQVGNWKSTSRRVATSQTIVEPGIHHRTRHHHEYRMAMVTNEDETTSQKIDLEENSIPILNGETNEVSLTSSEQTSFTESAVEEASPEAVTPVAPWKRILGLGKKPKSGMSFREQLTKAGLAVVLSYGAVSNASYGVCISIAWYGFSKKTGLSPLAPNQWTNFLAVYSAFFIFNNLVRPFRFAASVAVAPYFERLIQFTQSKFRVSRPVSIGLCVFLVNIVGTLSLMTIGISIASTLAGVPAVPIKLAASAI